MKKILTTLLLSALSVLSFAQGRQAGRGISGQTASQMLVRFKQDVIDLQPRAVAKVLNMENNFYTLPSDEADSRKLASDADRSCEAL